MIHPSSAPTTHGDLVQSLNALDAHLDETRQAMHNLINRYAATFQAPSCQLVFHVSAGVLALRWRNQGPNQRYFELCGSAFGERFLQLQDAAIVDLMLNFDHERVDLNFTYQARFYLRKQLRGLKKKRAAAKAMRLSYGPRAAQFT